MPANIAQKQQTNGNSLEPVIKPSPSIIIGANNPLPAKYSANNVSRNSSQKDLQNLSSIVSQNPIQSNPNHNKSDTKVESVDEFIPDDERSSFKMFLEEPINTPNNQNDIKYEETDR